MFWPDVELEDARNRRDKARRLLAAGGDPSFEKRKARALAIDSSANTFKTVAEEWVKKQEREGLADITLDKIRWLLGKAYGMQHWSDHLDALRDGAQIITGRFPKKENTEPTDKPQQQA